MYLVALIDHYFGGSRRAFSEAMGCSERTVHRWISENAVVANGRVHLPVKRDVNVPVMTPPMRRNDFETQMKTAHEDIDLTRIGDHYLSEQVQYVWIGWLLAQGVAADEALKPR